MGKDKILSKIYELFYQAYLREQENKKRNAPGCMIDRSAFVYPEAKVHNYSGGGIRVGAHTHFLGEIVTYKPDCSVTVGSDCFIGKDTRLWAYYGITVGNHVMIAHNCNIFDNDTHPVDPDIRRKQSKIQMMGGISEDIVIPGNRIVIEDDVWIGAYCTILKGVHIGKGAIIGSNSIVTKDITPYAIVHGNAASISRFVER